MYLNQAQVFCLTVYDGDSSALLAVGLAMLGGGRRLLVDGQAIEMNRSEWHGAAEPCRGLMLWSGAALGPVDLYMASECQRWRDIGERAVVRFNLTRVPPVAFTSFSLMMGFVASDSDAALELARCGPRLVAFLVSYQAWVQPVALLGMHYWRLLNGSSALVQSIVHPSELTMNRTAEVWALVVPNVVGIGRRVDATNGSSGGRRLLQASWKDNIATVRDYTVELVNGNAGGLSPDFASQWVKGPFTWPPHFDYRSTQSCLVASLLFNYTFFTFKSTAAYYTGDDAPPRPYVYRTFTECLPKLPYIAVSAQRALTTFESVTDVMRYLTMPPFLDRGYIMAYISRGRGGEASDLSRDVSILFTCDFNAVQHCTSFRRDLGWGLVVVALGIWILIFFLRAVGIVGLDTYLAWAYLPLVGVYVFGLSPLCLPMIPTCFLDEVIHLLGFLLPSSIEFPDTLQWWAGCATGLSDPPSPLLAARAARGTSSCFKSCLDPPFQYSSALDNFAWIALRLDLHIQDIPWPAFVSDNIPAVLAWFGMDSFTFTGAFAKKGVYLDWSDMRSAQDICCGLTLFNVLPFVLVCLAVSVLVGYVFVLMACIVQVTVALIFETFIYIHTR